MSTISHLDFIEPSNPNMIFGHMDQLQRFKFSKENIMCEHFPNRFKNHDGLPVMILESEYGNFHVRERGIMGNGNAIWFMRGIFGTIGEAVAFCAANFLDAAAPDHPQPNTGSAGDVAKGEA